IDAAHDRVAANFLVDVRPRAVAFSPDGDRVFVTNEISGSLSIVNGRTHELMTSIPLDSGRGKPVGVAVSPDGRLVYVANGASNRISIVDAESLREIAQIAVGRRPWNLALTRDGRWLYVANGGSNTISVIDTRTRRVTATWRT